MTDRPTPTHNEPAADLANRWLATKAKIGELQKQLVQIEKELIQFCDVVPEGARTTELPTGHKVTVKCGFNRRMNWADWKRIKADIPKALHPVKITEALDVVGLKYLANNEPETYKLISEALTVTQAKPSFDIRPPAPKLEEVV